MKIEPVRRLVTTETRDGAAIVAFDGAPPQTITLNGSHIHRLWESGPVPTRVPIVGDAGAIAGNAYRAGFAGTSLYVADIPPHTIRAIPVHREDSLDYIAVLAGEIHLLVGQDLRILRSGDILVQCGNWHTWENRAAEPCRLLVVVLRAERTQPES